MRIAMASSPVCILQQKSCSSVTVLASSTMVPQMLKGRNLVALSCPSSQTLACSPTCEISWKWSSHQRSIIAPLMQRGFCLRRCQASLVGNLSFSSKVVGRRSRQHVVCETAVEVGEGAQCSEGGHQKAEVGTRIKVKGPLIVYHVPKIPKFDIGGLEGEVKDVIFQHKGRPVSATFPYKVQFNIELEERKLKFFAHLKDDEFEVVV
ncbi:unnamed protein product [Sphagnum troendelagicum]|uniref:Ferredoxin thioredoxin reductase alpha chain domain-containing protein n=1 Tax=Sphagnum troendelagicum TaxID=128251 RepID=A0ABP0TJR3_9BRYO